MDFDSTKKIVLEKLYKPDASRKGDVDEEIAALIDSINSHKDYYTTSSCAGRIIILEESKDNIRHEINWLFYTHKKTTQKQILTSLAKAGNNLIWFRFESLILHICARDLESAIHLLNKAHKAGFKRAGITSLSNRIMLEIIGSQRFDAPIMKDKELLVSEQYIRILVQQANKKMLENWKRISTMEQEFKA